MMDELVEEITGVMYNFPLLLHKEQNNVWTNSFFAVKRETRWGERKLTPCTFFNKTSKSNLCTLEFFHLFEKVNIQPQAHWGTFFSFISLVFILMNIVILRLACLNITTTIFCTWNFVSGQKGMSFKIKTPSSMYGIWMLKADLSCTSLATGIWP